MRILFVTNDHVGKKRAGPAIRCVELAKVLSKHDHDVVIASARPGDLKLDGIYIIFDALANSRSLREAARSSDIIVAQGLVLFTFPFLRRMAKYLVVELYDPFLFEYLANPHSRFPSWGYLRQWHLLNEQLLRGDFFICANEKQWDYWLGRLCALGRLNLEEYQRDPSFRKLLAIIPFGISHTPPTHNHNVMKGIMRGISKNDIVLLWAGGIWQWFDPMTLIRAMALVKRQRSDIKLIFVATQHPDPTAKKMPIVEDARLMARELGLLETSVFFNDGWVPQDEMQNYLLEADIGVSTYWDTVETRFSFRTRVRDFIWAGLPMILTQGDSLAEMVERENLGKTVPSADTEGLKNAILELAANDNERRDIHNRLRALAPKFQWEAIAEPLLQYCAHPYRSPRTPRLRQTVIPPLNWAYRLSFRLRHRFRRQFDRKEPNSL